MLFGIDGKVKNVYVDTIICKYKPLQSLEGESKLTRNNSWETFLRKTFDRNSLKKKFSDFSPSLGIDESLPSATGD